MPSKLFYDERGSELFERITELPEYYLTRAEGSLLRHQVPRWIHDLRPRTLVELGAGSAVKTRVLLDAMQAEGCAGVYVPVDISEDFLKRTAGELRQEYEALEVLPVAADFTRALTLPPNLPHPTLLTFLGSTIGNFTSAEAVDILRGLRGTMAPADRFLLGVDLRKDVAVLEAAYNDREGVTAEFNLNVLRVINRRFSADFDPAAFRHRAVYDSREDRIEMHLVAERPQRVRIPGAGEFVFREGETVRTEISCKYDRAGVEGLLTSAGLELVDWAEEGDSLFALALAAPRGG